MVNSARGAASRRDMFIYSLFTKDLERFVQVPRCGRRRATHQEVTSMRTLSALAAATTVAVTAVATTTTAEAQWGWRGWGYGWRGPAFVGGLTTGAIIGAALARPYAYGYGPYASYGSYGGPYGYYSGPYVAYAAPIYAVRVYTGYPVYSGYYGCRRSGWNGYYGC